jgi:RES domain-containing protein
LNITAWRIFKPKHATTAFTGEGARLFGGRWNRKGTAVIYTAESVALAALEMLVHLQSRDILAAYFVAPVRFAASLVQALDRSRLPSNWRSDPAPSALQALGERWVAARKSAVLRVPSAIIDTESNYLLNPAHSDFRRIVVGKAERFHFDPRLAKERARLGGT